MREINAIFLFTGLFLTPLLSMGADKLKLGDFPTEEDSKSDERVRREMQEEDILTLEERKLLVDQLADDYFKKAIAALQKENFSEAKRYFEKTLILAPRHQSARRQLERLNMAQATRTTVDPNKIVTKPEKPSPQKSRFIEKFDLPTQEARERSEALYLKALFSSQNGDYALAYRLCREALQLDADNLQARRMAERLESRFGKP